MMKKRLWRSLLALLLVLVISSVFWLFKHSRGRIPTFAFGGKDLQIQLPDNYNWQQRDSRWQAQRLGEREQAGTLGEYGCTVSAIANAVSNLGFELTPQQLNQRLTEKGGFNERGWLIWDAIEAATDGTMQATVFSSPTRTDIDRCLSKEQYPIVKYLIGGLIQHWVTVVAKQNGHYLIRDPLIDNKEPITLSSRTPIILSVRCVGKKLASPYGVIPPAKPSPHPGS